MNCHIDVEVEVLADSEGAGAVVVSALLPSQQPFDEPLELIEHLTASQLEAIAEQVEARWQIEREAKEAAKESAMRAKGEV